MAKSEKLQLSKTWERVQQNESEIEKIQVIDVKNQDIAFNKKQRRIILLEDHFVASASAAASIIINVDFGQLPEWAIPFMHPHHVFRTSEGFEMGIAFFHYVNFLWKQIGQSYVLKVLTRGALSTDIEFDPAPLYLSLEILVLNDFVWHQIQQPKK